MRYLLSTACAADQLQVTLPFLLKWSTMDWNGEMKMVLRRSNAWRSSTLRCTVYHMVNMWQTGSMVASHSSWPYRYTPGPNAQSLFRPLQFWEVGVPSAMAHCCPIKKGSRRDAKGIAWHGICTREHSAAEYHAMRLNKVKGA